MKQALGSLLALLLLLFPFRAYASEECSAGGEDHVCVKLYGYVKLDASYDTRQIDAGNFARWVENTAAENGYLSITARQTRLGLSLKGPETESVKLGSGEYGIEILRVREIIGVMDVTYVPGTPDFVRGVINLRGKIIPVIDLKYKFGLGEAEITEKSCIIVVDVNSNGRVIQTGLLVDSVSEVLDVGDEDIEETPSFGDGVRVDFILGMAKVGDRVKILLDVDKVLSTAEMLQVASLRNEVEQE